MGAVLLQQAAQDPRVVPIVAGSILLAVLLTAVVLTFIRRAALNRGRTVRGNRALTGAEARSVRAAGGDLRTATDEEIAEATEAARQREWERQQAAQEMVRYGRSLVRAYCPTHDRWCKHPERGPHPPGGHDNERAPQAWQPDALN